MACAVRGFLGVKYVLLLVLRRKRGGGVSAGSLVRLGHCLEDHCLTYSRVHYPPPLYLFRTIVSVGQTIPIFVNNTHGFPY